MAVWTRWIKILLAEGKLHEPAKKPDRAPEEDPEAARQPVDFTGGKKALAPVLPAVAVHGVSRC